MIDTWLFTALVLGILALCVILRGIRTLSQNDRLVAGTVAVILVSMAALTISIAFGMLVMVDAIIVACIIGFGVMIWTGKQPEADRS
jgi:hypothetical protein